MRVFGDVYTCSFWDNHKISWELSWTFLEFLVMTRQNSHALDSEKVDRY